MSQVNSEKNPTQYRTIYHKLHLIETHVLVPAQDYLEYVHEHDKKATVIHPIYSV